MYPGQRPRRLNIYQNRPLYCLFDLTAIMSKNTNVNINNIPNSSFLGSFTRDIGAPLVIFQVNGEGLSRDRSCYLARLLLELKADVVLLQETSDVEQMHCREIIDGYKLISAAYHKQYGSAIYV